MYRIIAVQHAFEGTFEEIVTPYENNKFDTVREAANRIDDCIASEISALREAGIPCERKRDSVVSRETGHPVTTYYVIRT